MQAIIWAESKPSHAGARPLIEYGWINMAMPGQSECGDVWDIAQDQDHTRVFAADGLGHGLQAREAASEAARVFRESVGISLPETLAAINGALRSTRGAAVAIAELHPADETLRFAGIGNIAGRILNAISRSLVSHYGTVGTGLPRIQEFSYPWPAGSLLVLNSDGLASHWELDRYPGLMARHPALIAGVLYRDFSRGNDDTTIIVVRNTYERA